MDILAVQQDGAVGGLIDLGEQIEDGGFAGAVGPDEPRDFGAADGDIEVIHRLEPAEGHAEIDAFQNGADVGVTLREEGNAAVDRNKLGLLMGLDRHLRFLLLQGWGFLFCRTAQQRSRGDAAEKILHGGVIGGQHDDDEHDGIQEHPVVGKFPHGLRQGGKHDGGDDGAGDAAHAAQHHDNKDFDGHIVIEGGGLDIGEEMAYSVPAAPAKKAAMVKTVSL